MTRPVLYFDVGSPFAYLAAVGAEAVLDAEVLAAVQRRSESTSPTSGRRFTRA